ncbi:DMT family transporter [Tranquillimonas alkanivorans]|uniref:Permease of the drug/metabolite transporter (DMT) superfamily n=1 Tax=Tranquillimonas alkanivorans TaxID=441119 RepID=A0A1I5UIS4_9RHOB|nr:DMT family transporter [Tranquillimonas alkanivorans]SFP95118.1 Permease of the drug/metabolite transporter (DMT) superfamily [Tranquillimonas alkanivorans]
MSDTRRTVEGVCLGLLAAVAWGLYNVGAELGQAQGFHPADLTMLRYGGAAALMLPVLIAARHRMPPLSRVAILALLIGPGFALLFNAGFQRAPLSHAVVLGPGTSMLVANLIGVVRDRAPLTRNRSLGMAVLILGLVTIAADQPTAKHWGGSVAVGDLCFLGSGTLWGIHVYLMGRWQMPPVRTTAGVATLSSLVFLPIYFSVFDVTPMPWSAWARQFVYQGAIGGCLAFLVFAAAVLRLGAGRAALFSALVPVVAVLLGIPLAAQVPSVLQWWGVGLATLGLTISLDIRRRRAMASGAGEAGACQ